MPDNKVWLEIKGNAASALSAIQSLTGAFGKAQAEANKASANMCSSFAGVTKSIIAATGATTLISSSIGELISLFKQGFTAVDKYKIGVATLAAFTMTFMEDQQNGDVGKQWDIANKYAQDLYRTLEQVGAKTLMTGQQAVMLGQEFLKNGVAIDGQNQKQIEGLEAIANALFVVTGGHNVELQIITEIDHLLKGQVTAQDRLGKLLQAADPLLKEHLATWMKEGSVIQNIGILLKGFNAATGEFAGSWEAVKSTLISTVDQVLRNGMKPVYQDIIQLTMKLNNYLTEHREEIKTKLLAAYNDLKAVVEKVWNFSKQIYDLWQQYGLGFKNTVEAIGAAIVLQWVVGLAQAEKFMISLVALGNRFLPFLAAYAAWKVKDTIDKTDPKDVMVGHAVEKVLNLQKQLDTARAINSSRVTEIAMELASAERERDELLLLYRADKPKPAVAASTAVSPPKLRPPVDQDAEKKKFSEAAKEFKKYMEGWDKAEVALEKHIEELSRTEVENAKAKAFEKYAIKAKYAELTNEEMQAYADEAAKIEAEAQTKMWDAQLKARNEWIESMAGAAEQFSKLSLAEQKDMIPFIEQLILKYSELGLVGEEAFKKLVDALIKYNEEMDKATKKTDTFNAGFTKGWSDFLKQAADTYKQGEELAKNTAQAMQSAFSDFFFDAMTGKLKSLADYWQSFSNTILKLISEMIAKQAMIGLFGNGAGGGGLLSDIFKLLGGGGSPGGGAGGPLMDGLNYPGLHTGGMIIPQFHFGGLRSDERLAINKVGERYITSEQNAWLTNLSSAMKNMSSGGGQPQEVNNHYYIQAVDSKSFADIVEKNPGAVTKVVSENLRRNGGLRKAFKGAV